MKSREPHWIEAFVFWIDAVIFFGSICAGLAGFHGLCIWGAIFLVGGEISYAIKNLKQK